MDAEGLGRPLAGPADEDPRFPTLAHFREQAELLAEEGVDLIALEMICARSALATPELAAITVMHSQPEASLAAIEIIRRHFAGPIGVYTETGDLQPPN